MYEHLNWRDFVRAALHRRGWTQRDLAPKLQMSEANLSALLSGRHRLDEARVDLFTEAFDLGEEERSWFAALVDQESRSERARRGAEAHIRSLLAQHRSASPGQDAVDAQADWRVNVVQELAACTGFRADPAWLGAVVEPELTPEAAAEVWDRVRQTGLVKERADGGFDAVSVRTESVLAASATMAGRQLQGSVFQLAVAGATRFAPNERHGGVITMALSEAAAERVLQRLRELEQELVQLAVDDPGPRNRVYFLTTQLFPASAYTDTDTDAPAAR